MMGRNETYIRISFSIAVFFWGRLLIFVLGVEGGRYCCWLMTDGLHLLHSNMKVWIDNTWYFFVSSSSCLVWFVCDAWGRWCYPSLLLVTSSSSRSFTVIIRGFQRSLWFEGSLSLMRCRWKSDTLISQDFLCYNDQVCIYVSEERVARDKDWGATDDAHLTRVLLRINLWCCCQVYMYNRYDLHYGHASSAFVRLQEKRTILVRRAPTRSYVGIREWRQG